MEKQVNKRSLYEIEALKHKIFAGLGKIISFEKLAYDQAINNLKMKYEGNIK